MESTAKARKGRQQPSHAETQGVLDLAAGVQPEPAQDTTSAKLPTPVKRERPALLPLRHTDRDFFLADLFDYAMKDDGASMEAPIFTLSTKVDLSTWT